MRKNPNPRGADGRRLVRARAATMGATGYRKGTLSGAFGVLGWSAVRSINYAALCRPMGTTLACSPRSVSR